MAGVDLRSGETVRGWSTGHPDPDLEDHGPGPYPAEFDLAEPRGRDAWAPGGRSRRSGWHWPRPLGGTGALLVVTVVLIAAVAVVAAGSGHARSAPRPNRSAAVPAPAAPNGFQFGSVGYDPTAGPADPVGTDPTPALPDLGATATTPPPKSGSGQPAPKSPGPSDQAVPDGDLLTGVGCPTTANVTFFAHYLAGAPMEVRTGGYAGAGCAGWFWSVPMSGSATDDPDTYVVWSFTTAPLDHGHCEIRAYVPQAASAQEAAGNPTFYQVMRSRTDSKPTGSFSINQTANRGQWVDTGSFAFDHGQLAVKLVNRGSGTGGARHAAAQLMLRCGS